MDPRQECTVADKAPGKLATGDAPMDRANTTASAEFCIPVSIDIVRLVTSENFRPNFGTKYPMVNPTQCNINTDPTINGKRALDDRNILAFCDTTPPQIKATKTTDANGVNLETLDARLGALALTIIPINTGNRMTRAV
eukprot:CAMPEP_0113645714 /NCGR_PEP_ID=MMETSP0017_2-20120614/24108_1 /TAXON_ID=2856 /ORGANISM="Cylindrotheca closterium" /LENGTH=138 /DNA_ID=CAMNT_0000557489 /DNA_START=47 /DNA_END=460 /DNA_ORIENTATION=- /assembly_acc=CAM_ASM_000147